MFIHYKIIDIYTKVFKYFWAKLFFFIFNILLLIPIANGEQVEIGYIYIGECRDRFRKVEMVKISNR